MSASTPDPCAVPVRVLLLASVMCGISLGAQGAPKAKERSFWYASLTADGGYDSNPVYVDSGARADNLSRIGLQMAIYRRRPKGEVRLTTNVSASEYQNNAQLSNKAYGASVRGERRFTATFTGSGSAGYDTRLSSDLVGQVGLPILRVATQHALTLGASGENRFSSRTGAVVRVNYTSVTFDQPFLVPGAAVNASATFTHKLNMRDAAISEVSVQQGEAQGQALAFQTWQVGWDTKFSRIMLRALIGATRGSSGGAPAKVLPSGSMIASRPVGPGVVSASVSRTASQAFGLGALLTNTGGALSYDFQARRGNVVSLAASVAQSRFTNLTVAPVKSRSVSMSVRRVLRSGVTITAASAYRARQDATTATGIGASFGLGYTFGSQ